jgi:PilZ domain
MARGTSRFPFSASAEVSSDDLVELTRVTELSRYGCYLETSKRWTPGTQVTVKITKKHRLFEATASVLYSRPTMGMGLVFREVKPFYQTILEDWLQESLKEQDQGPSIKNCETE